MTELVDFLHARFDEDLRVAFNPALMPVTGPGLSDLVKRARAEVEAKRRIVEKLAYWDRMADEAGVAALSNFARGERTGWHTACCLLALPYADHDDYRQEWALS